MSTSTQKSLLEKQLSEKIVKVDRQRNRIFLGEKEIKDKTLQDLKGSARVLRQSKAMSLIRDHIVSLSAKNIVIDSVSLEQVSFYKGHVAAIEVMDKIIDSLLEID